jgi:hypothetical protein
MKTNRAKRSPCKMAAFQFAPTGRFSPPADMVPAGQMAGFESDWSDWTYRATVPAIDAQLAGGPPLGPVCRM